MPDRDGVAHDDEAEQAVAPPTVAACRSRPDRLVFIEHDNSDGWIATDHTVAVHR